MKRIYAILLSVLFFTACYKEDVDRLFAEQSQLEALIQELREYCKQTNDQVDFLKTLINGSMIKEVSAFEEPETGKSGWEIFFTDGTSFRIYNGLDGSTPEISTVQEGDCWYWTLNGEKLLDNDGNPLRVNGKDGMTPTISPEGYWVIGGVVTGIQASGNKPRVEINADGYWVIDGVVTSVKASVQEPLLAIGAELIDQGILKDKAENVVENTAWYLSVDGETWVRISGRDGGNTGEGGNPGLIESVTVSPDGMTVRIVLSNGQEIQVPSWAWAQSLTERVNDLVDALETWISQAKYITEVTPLQDGSGNATGWRIHYSDDTFSDVYNGKDGEIPLVSVVKEGNDYFWTLNGEKLLVEGQPVKASAVKPEIRFGEELEGKTDTEGNPVEAGIWYLSVDGEAWTRITGPGGDAFFKEAPKVDVGKGSVVFTLQNGTQIEVALYDWVKSNFDTINKEFERINTLLESLKQRKYITKVEEVKSADGTYVQQYRVVFSDDTEILLGNTMIGIRAATSADGGDLNDLYWTVNGTDLLFNGRPVKANAQDALGAPQVKTGTELINTGVTTAVGGEAIIASANYLSVDGGGQWVRLTGDQGITGDKGDQGDPGKNGIIIGVEYDENGNFVTFKLGNGGEDIVLPTVTWMRAMNSLLDKVNEKLTTLQTLLQKSSYVIDTITEVRNEAGVVVGYDLKCRHLSTGRARILKIRNGEKGDPGAVPVISIKKGEDGKYYWTVNDEVMTDEEGNPVPVNGADGLSGENAPVPRVELGSNLTGVTADAQGNPIDGYAVYLSVDNGTKWTKISSPAGNPGAGDNSGETGTPDDPTNSGFSAQLSDDGYWLECTFDGGTTLKVPTKKWADEVKGKLDDLNTNVENLKKLLQNAKFIKEVRTFTEEGRSGWEIVCMDLDGQQLSPTYKIYNGERGEAGSQGDIPAIGVSGDPDKPDENALYWTLDGKLMKGPDGSNIPVTGKDAPAPQIQTGVSLLDKISQDADGQPILPAACYLSVDGGTMWYKVSGEKGEKGDSFIKNIDTKSSDEYVIFEMADGTEFKVAKYIEITVTFENVGDIFSIAKNTNRAVNFTVSGSCAKNLSLTTVVGGNWKVLQQYDGAEGRGSLTIQAPGDWDYNKVVLLLADQKGRVWTSSLKVETNWTAGDPFVDSRDERTYQIRRFADNKLWMTEDLKYGKASGYTYDELSDDLCPDGWRLPVNDDWQHLSDKFEPDFGAASVGGGWWSATAPITDGTVSIWQINYPGVSSEQVGKTIPRSVRCVKDDSSSPYR